MNDEIRNLVAAMSAIQREISYLRVDKEFYKPGRMFGYRRYLIESQILELEHQFQELLKQYKEAKEGANESS